MPKKFAMRWICAGAALALGMMGAAGSGEAQAAGEEPFWGSLRKPQANLRVGPGRAYRISWVYQRGGLPVKVLRTMSGWVLIEDPDGARGWMLKQFVGRARAAIVKGGVTDIRENKDGSGRTLWRAEPGVIAELGACSGEWCKVAVDGREGFVARSALWGAAQL